MTTDKHSLPIHDLSMRPRPSDRETRHAPARQETIRNRGNENERG